jgi:glycosyltransferase involved in cell wall biosynthesis
VFVSLERRAARWCDRIVTLTDRGREDHLAWGVGEFDQFVTIPSGVPLEPFRKAGIGREAARASLGLPNDAYVLGCVARLVPVKGQVYLLEAAARLVETIPSLRLVLVGGGERREALEARATSGPLEGKVVFTGMVLDPRPALAAMDLFVMPSLNEGQGRAVVEAMAAGLPVVASAVGGLPEVLDGGAAGVLVPPADAEALARVIERLASSPEEAARLSEAGIRRADRYSEATMIDATASLYSELLSGPTGG